LQPTQWQIGIAGLYGIPRQQAHTISIERATAYFRHQRTPQQRLERWLDVYCGRERCDTTMICTVNHEEL
jgi:hypothetical protein